MEASLFQTKARTIREAATLEDASYSCGALFQELDLPESLSCLQVFDHNCNNTMRLVFSLFVCTVLVQMT